MDTDNESAESMVDTQMSIEAVVRCIFLAYFIKEKHILYS